MNNTAEPIILQGKERLDFYKKLQSSPLNRLNDYFTIACRDGDLETVKYLLTSDNLEQHVDIHFNNEEAFRKACHYGRTSVVRYLTTSSELQEKPDMYALNCLGPISAIDKNYEELVECLIVEAHLELKPQLKRYVDKKPVIKKMFEVKKLYDSVNKNVKSKEDTNYIKRNKL